MFGVPCRYMDFLGFWGFLGTLRLLKMGKRCVILEYKLLGLQGEPNTKCNVVLTESGSPPILHHTPYSVLFNLFVQSCGWPYKCTRNPYLRACFLSCQEASKLTMGY